MHMQIKRATVIPKALKKCFLSIYVFILVFSPPLIPYPHLFLAVASAMVLLMQRTEPSLRIASQSGLLQWMTSMILFTFYVLTVPFPISVVLGDVLNLQHYMHIFNRYGVLFVTIAPCSVFLIKAIRKYPYEYFIEIMFYAGLMEGICSMLAYFFPPVKQIFLFLMRRYSSIYDNTWYSTVRAFGFAGTMVDLFGLGIALIAGVCFYCGISLKHKRRYILFSFMIAVSAFLNARTGVILFAVGIALTAYETIRSRHAGNILALVTLFVVAPSIAAFILNHVRINQDSSAWIKSGLESVIGFFQTGDIRVLKSDKGMALLFSSRFWNFPDFPMCLIGTGHTLFAIGGNQSSDVGYVNDLWLGGIFAYIFLYKDVLIMGFRLLRQKSNRLMRFVGGYCILSFLIFNIKAQAIGHSPGGVALFLFLFVSTYYARKFKRDRYYAYLIPSGGRSGEGETG